MIDEDVKHALMDCGALGYSDAQIMLAVGLDKKSFNAAMSDGGRALIEQGLARFEFAVDRKLMELAANGDIKAIDSLNKRQSRMRARSESIARENKA